MAASAFAGTGVYKATAVCSSFIKPGQRFVFNGGFTVTVKGNQTILIHKDGVKISGPFTQSELQRLWQDVASIGL